MCCIHADARLHTRVPSHARQRTYPHTYTHRLIHWGVSRQHVLAQVILAHPWEHERAHVLTCAHTCADARMCTLTHTHTRALPAARFLSDARTHARIHARECAHAPGCRAPQSAARCARSLQPGPSVAHGPTACAASHADCSAHTPAARCPGSAPARLGS